MRAISRGSGDRDEPQIPCTVLRHGRYLRNWSTTTFRIYNQGLRSLDIEQPTRADLEALVMRLRPCGLQPGGVNMYVRTVSSYLTWLHEEGHTPTRLRVKQLRAPIRQPVLLLTDADVRAIVTYRAPQVERQAWAILLTLLDTGLRISEALTPERARVNLDTLVLTVCGKGNKGRTVPIMHLVSRVVVT